MVIDSFGRDSFDSADTSFQGLGKLESTYIYGTIYGCMDCGTYWESVNSIFCDGVSAASTVGSINYNPNVTVDDGSCVVVVFGCMNLSASNYDPNANIDDGSCAYGGCTNPLYANYNASATWDDGSCSNLVTYGCTIATANTIGDGTSFMYQLYVNYDPLATHPCNGTGGGGSCCCGNVAGPNCCCQPTVVGCMDSTASNYNPNANFDPTSLNPSSTLACVAAVSGCTDPLANNYNVTANVNDGSCSYDGCMDPNAQNHMCASSLNPGSTTACNDNVNHNDGSCVYFCIDCNDPTAITTVPGCCDSVANNYYSWATCDDGSCTYAMGCTIGVADNYDPNAVHDDGSCTFSGCTRNVLNYTTNNLDPLIGTSITTGANGYPYYNIVVVEDGSCTFTGCPDDTSLQWQGLMTMYIGTWGLTNSIITDTTPSSCTYPVSGCTDVNACNYDSAATVDDGSCNLPDGCTDPLACNYDSTALCDDNTCNLPDGCTDPTACNYDPAATCDDGSCHFLFGCTDPAACNYDSTAICDDGSCLIDYGCMDATACNYDPLATCDDGTCTGVLGCNDPTACNFNTLATCDDGSCIGLLGCMDGGACTVTACGYDSPYPNVQATNYDVNATCDDGSCLYLPCCTDTNSVSKCVGDTYQGGIIFHLTDPGCEAYIASTADQSNDANWGCHGQVIAGTDGELLGDGIANTSNILSTCTTANIAADHADDYSTGSYTDWYLPSKDELYEMWNNIGPGDALSLGNLANLYDGPINLPTDGMYWSSTQPSGTGVDAKTKAWGLQSSSSAGSSQGSIMSMEDKYELLNVRAIRTEIIVALIPGCMDVNSPNYDPTATQNDGSCIGIGDTYEGGTIFYLDGTGGGMVVHPGNVGGVEQWGDTNHTVGTSDLVGSGAANTAAIIAHATANSYTAAASLTVGTFNNFSDWYLPSKEEVQAIFTNLPTATIQGWISTFPVWSSTEHFNNTSHRAYARNTNQTTPYGYAKTVGLYVMPIRNF